MNLQLTAMNLHVTEKSKSRLIPGVYHKDNSICTLVCQATLNLIPGKKIVYRKTAYLLMSMSFSGVLQF